jgi:hypothetical protein
MDAATALGVTVVTVPVVGGLLDLLIRCRSRSAIERARQMAALEALPLIQPGSVVVVQQPDGTTSMVLRLPERPNAPDPPAVSR